MGNEVGQWVTYSVTFDARKSRLLSIRILLAPDVRIGGSMLVARCKQALWGNGPNTSEHAVQEGFCFPASLASSIHPAAIRSQNSLSAGSLARSASRRQSSASLCSFFASMLHSYQNSLCRYLLTASMQKMSHSESQMVVRPRGQLLARAAATRGYGPVSTLNGPIENREGRRAECCPEAATFTFEHLVGTRRMVPASFAG
jgi:hypothetical protein